MATAVLGGGCFWCVEGAFKNMRGVESVLPGYSGGNTTNPTYEAICSGTTGHAEVVEIKFDQSQISFETILEVFFTVHDPTQLNRQGNDVGTQYRSVIFYLDQDQKRIAEKMAIEFGEYFSNDLVTEISPLGTFFIAITHHDYFANNPQSRYCQMVVAPKLKKLREKLSHLY
jgi:peptide-methionine (S)-S-oxide reductase